MRRHLVASALLALSATTLSAQVTANAPVTANIVSTLTMNATGSTNFGDVSNQPHVETLNPVTPGAGKSTAIFTVGLESGRRVNYSCPSTVALAGPNASTMTFTPQFAWSTSTQATGVVLSGPGCTFASLTNSFITYQLYLGGSLNVVAGLPLGAYTGTMTITAAY